MAANTRHHLLVSLKEAHGNWVSGEVLSRKLGVTRTAIWKHACSLRSEGYAIDSSTRKGYLLRETLDRLLPAEIEASLRSVRLGRRIVFCLIDRADDPLANCGIGHRTQGRRRPRSRRGRGSVRSLPVLRGPCRNLQGDVLLQEMRP